MAQDREGQRGKKGGRERGRERESSGDEKVFRLCVCVRETERQRQRQRQRKPGVFTSENGIEGEENSPFPNLNAVRQQNKLPSEEVDSLALEAFELGEITSFGGLSVPVNPSWLRAL